MYFHYKFTSSKLGCHLTSMSGGVNTWYCVFFSIYILYTPLQVNSIHCGRGQEVLWSQVAKGDNGGTEQSKGYLSWWCIADKSSLHPARVARSIFERLSLFYKFKTILHDALWTVVSLIWTNKKLAGQQSITISLTSKCFMASLLTPLSLLIFERGCGWGTGQRVQISWPKL